MNAPKVLLIKRPAKLPSGRRVQYWTLRWSDGNGKDRYESLGRVGNVTANEAKTAQRQKMLDFGMGKVRRKPQKITLSVYLDMDRDAIKAEVKESTLLVHAGVSNHAIAAIGNDIELARIDWSHVAQLKNWLGQEHELTGKKFPPCSKATIRRTVATLKAIFNRAVKRGVIDANPFANERLAKIQPKQKRIYSREEVTCMVEVSPNVWWKAFIRLGFTSGLRLGEILNLTWEDIDDEAGYLTVSAKRTGRFEVGDRDYPVLAFSCKSHRERTVPLHPDAAVLLKRLRVKSGGSIYPFLSLQRLVMLNARFDTAKEIQAFRLMNNTLREFKRIQTSARRFLAKRQGRELKDMDWRIGTIHDLRKSYGTHMAKHVSMPELKKLMGHASITTTSEFYVDVSADVADMVKMAFAG